MAANSIDSDQYVDGSIDTAHIADDAVTSAKLDTNIAIAGTLGSTGKITADAGIDIDNFNIDGTTIALSSGEMTIDVADNIKLDSGSGEIRFFDGGTYFGKIIENSGNLQLISGQQDKDILFVGNDNGSAVTALTLDMSAAGAATFNSSITATGLSVTSSSHTAITIQAGTNTSASLRLKNDAQDWDVNCQTNDTFAIFNQTNSTQPFSILPSGNVGIGLATPTEKLTVAGNILANASNGSGFKLNGGNAIVRQDSGMAFQTNSGERLRIDSSGNVIVGKTSTSFSTDGAVFYGSGYNDFVNTSAPVQSLNRQTSDGAIVNYYKDAALVGSIGVNTGDKIYLGTGASGVAFSTAGLLPFSPSANNWSDNSLNLGLSGIRWKDLYLSGGVHLGGTTAANKLDDYEEGTWTPTVAGGTAGYQVRIGRYTKIGNIVRLRCSVKLNSWSGAGNVSVSGIPFATITGAYDHDWGACNIEGKPNNAIWVAGGSGSTVFFRRQDVTNADTPMAHTDIDANTGIMFTVVYQTS